EVGEAEVGVGGEDGGERDAREVVPLGDHLRADEHLDIATAEALQESGRASRPAGGVAVKNVDGGFREELTEGLLHPLGASPHRLQRLLVADRAALGHADRRAAVMAEQAAGAAMVGARQAAVRTAEVFAAGAAEEHRRIATAVA